MPVKAFITEHCTTGLPAFKAASQNLTVLTGLRIHHLSGIRLSVSGYESSYSVLQLPRKMQKNPQDSSNNQHMARGTKEQRYSSCHQHKFIIIIFLLDWNNSKGALKIGFSQCRSTCLKPYHNTEMQHQNLIHVPADRCRAFESSQGCLPRFNTSKLKKKKVNYDYIQTKFLPGTLSDRALPLWSLCFSREIQKAVAQNILFWDHSVVSETFSDHLSHHLFVHFNI